MNVCAQRQNGCLTGGTYESSTCVYVCLRSYQIMISSDLMVGLTILYMHHTSLAVHRSLASETSIIPQHSFHSDKDTTVNMHMYRALLELYCMIRLIYCTVGPS